MQHEQPLMYSVFVSSGESGRKGLPNDYTPGPDSPGMRYARPGSGTGRKDEAPGFPEASQPKKQLLLPDYGSITMQNNY